MKTLIMAAAALSTLAAAPALAQSASATVAFEANVDKACGVGGHLSGATADAAWAQGDIEFGEITGSDGRLSATPVTNRSFGNMWCNTAGTVSMTVSPLVNLASVGPDTGSFTNVLDVSVNTDMSVYWTANVPGGTLVTNGAPVSSPTGVSTQGAFETGLRRYSSINSITILPNAANKRPIAGDYRGTITVAIAAN